MTSVNWTKVFRLLFRITPNRLMLRLAGLATPLPIAEVVIVGRHSGIARRYPLSLLRWEDGQYIGHPNGRAQWVENLVAAGSAVVTVRSRHQTVRPVELSDGPERDAVVRATSQQPFPANLIYRAARRHVASAGAYFRLEPVFDEGVP
jgi:hypothetical protein